MRTVYLVCLMLLLCGMGAALAQQQQVPGMGADFVASCMGNKNFPASEVQCLRLKTAFQEAEIAGMLLQKAQDEANAKGKLFNDATIAVKKENNWGDSVTWSYGMGAFIDTKPPAPPTPQAPTSTPPTAVPAK